MLSEIPEALRELLKKGGLSEEVCENFKLISEDDRRWVLQIPGGGKLKNLDGLEKTLEFAAGGYNANDGTVYFSKPPGRKVDEVPATPAPNVFNEHLESQLAKTNSKNTYDLKASVEFLPMLKEARPIIQDEKGVKIDGWNRLAVDKEWPTVTVPIKDELTHMIARFALNFCRRKLSEKEKRDAMTAFHLKTGWSPKEMAERLPVSYSFIMKYLPDKYKDVCKSAAGKKGAEVKAEVAKRLATRNIAPISGAHVAATVAPTAPLANVEPCQERKDPSTITKDPACNELPEPFTLEEFPKPEIIHDKHGSFKRLNEHEVEEWRENTVEKLEFLLREDEQLQNMTKREVVQMFLEAVR